MTNTMKRVEAPELLACPVSWCTDSRPIISLGGSHLRRVRCNECETQTPLFYTEADAITAWNTRTPSPEIAGLVSALEASDGMSIGPNGSGGTKVLINFADHVPAGKLFSLLSDLSALATWSKP